MERELLTKMMERDMRARNIKAIVSVSLIIASMAMVLAILLTR